MFAFISDLDADLGPGCDAEIADLCTVKANVSTFLEKSTLRQGVHEIDNEFTSMLVDRRNLDFLNTPAANLETAGLLI